jgi:radical SAM protein with 4Fe4S-binding SPASM domain
MVDPLHINIYMTAECNRECPQCYYPDGKGKMTVKMSEKISLWICDLMRNGNVPEYRIHFLGGEPLLNRHPMLKIVDIVNANKPDLSNPAPEGGFVVFTNGDFLSNTTLKMLKRRNIKILLNPTNNPLCEIEKRILKIKKICRGCSLAIVLDEFNMPRLPQLTELAVQYGCHMRVNRLYHGGTIPGYVDEYEKQMGKMFEILLGAERSMWPNFIMESMTVTWPGPKNPNACGRWFLVVDPDGTVRSCNADMETVIGHISTHRSIRDFKFPQRWSAKNLSECQGCEWIMWCQGGCPYTRKLTYGTYGKRTPFCGAFKKLFPMLFELKNRWLKQQKKL